MSQRHRSQDMAPPPKVELRAHAHNERHRINAELSAAAATISAGLEPEDVHEPGRAWVPLHHHDAERGREMAQRRRPKHWKMKMWKRRSAVRRARAAAIRSAGA
jgi:hypothetical protein